MIESGDVVVRLGDMRLVAAISDGQITDLCAINDLGESNRDEAELAWAIDRINGHAMMLTWPEGGKKAWRELSGHERMQLMSQLRARLVLAKIDREAAARHPEQTEEIERMLGERDGAGLD